MKNTSFTHYIPSKLFGNLVVSTVMADGKQSGSHTGRYCLLCYVLDHHQIIPIGVVMIHESEVRNNFKSNSSTLSLNIKNTFRDKRKKKKRKKESNMLEMLKTKQTMFDLYPKQAFVMRWMSSTLLKNNNYLLWNIPINKIRESEEILCVMVCFITPFVGCFIKISSHCEVFSLLLTLFSHK